MGALKGLLENDVIFLPNRSKKSSEINKITSSTVNEDSEKFKKDSIFL